MKIYCYAHTHWDFEWYFTNSESAVQLLYHMDEVFYALENNLISHYHLDGQLSIVEDYLSSAPGSVEKFTKYVQEGRIIIGPWYTQSDECVISGESVIRNLYYGIKTAEKFGKWMKIGYLPDSFGQSKDMPKILNGFGIQNFLFWRGLSADKCPYREFIWKSPDGSSVLSYNIRNGYFYGTSILQNNNTEEVEKIFLEGCGRQIALLPIGADQRNVDYPFKQRLEYYNKNSFHKLEYLERTCEEFFDSLSKEEGLPVVEGELLDPSYSKIHRSIYSSRYDHKYYNDKIERRLIYQLEPLMVMAGNMGLEMKPDALEHLWKTLLMNHAHDSACGCNSDKTNKTILSRFQAADESSYSFCDYIIRKLAISFQESKLNDLYIYNTLPLPRNGLCKLTLSTEQEQFRIYGQDGREVPFQIITTEQDYRGSIRKNSAGYDPNLFYYVHKIWIKLQVPPLGVSKFKIVEEPSEAASPQEYSGKIENSRHRVELKEGNILIVDKQSQDRCTLFLEDNGDDGDTYDYSPPVPDRIERLSFVNADCRVTPGKLVQTLSLTGTFLLWKDLSARQSGEGRVSAPYQLDISLHEDELIRTKLTINNTAHDHRMRLILSTGISSSVSVADTLCGTIRRDNTPAHIDNWREIGWREEPSPIYPALHFTGLENASSSAFALLKGIKEYEILEDSKIALTLFRSVAFLGKPDLLRRPGIASGKEFKYVPTPESQLEGRHVFKNAFYLGNKKTPAQIKLLWMDYAINPLYYQVQKLNVNCTTLQYFVSNPLENPTVSIPSMLDIGQLGVEIQSMMPCGKNSYFIRFLNNSAAETEGGSLTFPSPICYQFTSLGGAPLTEKKWGTTIELGSFRQEEIKTLLCFFKPV